MKTINRKRLLDKKNSIEDLTLINTLPEKLFDDNQITGSINIPQQQNDFAERISLAVMDYKDAEIVVYSANEHCDSSTKAARKLIDAGFRNVYDYEGGAADWKEADQDEESSGQETV